LTITELAPDPQALFDFYRRVNIQPLGKVSDADLAQRLTAQPQVLCVVNTRRHAKGLFDLLDPDGSFHLSTLMCPAHRQQTLAEIRARLKAGQTCRVVSTQVIEAGVDLDFPAGYRAHAGLDSIIQVAGRVNRERTRPRGELYVFEPDSALMKRTPTFIAQTAQAGASVLRDFRDDPTSIRAVAAYFQLLDALRDPQRADDVNRILADLDKERFNFDFAKAGEKFRLIEAATVPVIIRFDAAAEELLDRLYWSKFPAAYARPLQRYTVAIYEREFQALQAKGAIDTYHDVYSVLRDETYYDEHTGLALLSDPGGEAVFFD